MSYERQSAAGPRGRVLCAPADEQKAKETEIRREPEGNRRRKRMLFKREDINAGVEECRSTPGAVLLDVREADEFRAGHIPGR